MTPPSTRNECKTDVNSIKRSKILASPGAKAWNGWLAENGDWDPEILVTLGSPPERPSSPEWFLGSWRRVLAGYWSRKAQQVRYFLVANRGPSGNGRGSAHVAFEPPLPDLKLLERLWRTHGTWVLSRDGNLAVEYIAKNCDEPDAEYDHWRQPVVIPRLLLTHDPADGMSARWLYENDMGHEL